MLEQKAKQAPRNHGQAVQQINHLLFCVEQWASSSGR
jgi:hypothetical protein